MDIFSYKCELVKCSCLVSCRAKKKILVISNTNILQSTVEIFENFSTSFQTRALQDPTVIFVQKCFFFKNLVLVIEMAVLERFW